MEAKTRRRKDRRGTIAGIKKALELRKALREGKYVYIKGRRATRIELVPALRTTAVLVQYVDGKREMIYPSRLAALRTTVF